MVDDTPKDDVPVIPQDVQQLQQQIPHILVNVRWSTRLSRPPKRFYPSLYSVLLTDVGEPECYDEVVQVDTKIQWESAMKEEIDSLLKLRLEIYASCVQVKRLYKINRFIG